MCPACLASVTLIAAGTATGAGATTLVLKKLLDKCRRRRSAMPSDAGVAQVPRTR
jgi:hypothetical protein